jgi:hypothetical protein
MAIGLEGCTIEEQRSAMHISVVKGINAKDINKCSLFMVRSGCRVKRFTTGLSNSLKDVRKSQMLPDQVRKWLVQQSKHLYAAGFRRTGEAMGQVYQSFGRICREMKMFCSRFECHMFYVLYPFVTYLPTLPDTKEIRMRNYLFY